MLPTQPPVRMVLLFFFFKSRPLHQIFFKNIISILTYPYWLRSAAMLNVQRLHQLFTDEIGCVKFMSVSKATKEKKIFSKPCFNGRLDNS